MEVGQLNLKVSNGGRGGLGREGNHLIHCLFSPPTVKTAPSLCSLKCVNKTKTKNLLFWILPLRVRQITLMCKVVKSKNGEWWVLLIDLRCLFIL